LASRDLAVAEVKRSQGTIGFASLAEAEKTASDARVSALEATFAREKALRALVAAVGDSGSALDLAGLRAPDCELADDLLSAPAVSAGVAAARRDRTVAELRRILAGASDAPTLALSAAATVPGPISLLGNDSSAASWTATAAVSVPVPTGQGSAKRQAADARVDAAQCAETAAVRQAEDEAAALRNAWAAALQREALCETLASQARSRLAEVTVALDTQTATKLDVDRAKVALDRAEGAWEDARSARFKAALDVYAYRGLDPVDLVAEKSQKE
jgi:outer membrane protein TolC